MIKLVSINEPVPLIGHIAFGIIDRGTNLLQIRPFSNCPMSCKFCSVDAGPKSRHRRVEFIVDAEHLLNWSNYVISRKIHKVGILIDGVGEPILHPDIHKIISGLKENEKVFEVAIETHGLPLTRSLINKLANSGLDRINLSIDSLDEEKARQLAGHNGYSVKRVVEMAIYAKQNGIDVLLTPVWLPGVNDKDMIEIIKLAKENGFRLGIQKYVRHQKGRKLPNINEPSWKEFYKFLDNLEKVTDVKLKLSPSDFMVVQDVRLGPIMDVGEKVVGRVFSEGWMYNEVLVIAKNRVVTVTGVDDLPEGIEVKIKITRNKDEIYLAKMA
ncbi:radical SAM protein [Sulfolobus tengchongensis]|uniref:Radical SAM protein n=1 Tax=Sulfolobus tengchongensis TaxID=207809 RepID=A0AAX4L3K6_9CREN